MPGDLSTVEQGAIVLLIVAGCTLATGLLLFVLVRAAVREATRATYSVASSAWNDATLVDAGRARIGGVVATDEEMLVELDWIDEDASVDEHANSWLIGPPSATNVTVLNKWHDAGAVVVVRRGNHRVILQPEQQKSA